MKNKQMHSGWQTSKQKLAAVRKELHVLRGAAGKHVQYIYIYILLVVLLGNRK